MRTILALSIFVLGSASTAHANKVGIQVEPERQLQDYKNCMSEQFNLVLAKKLSEKGLRRGTVTWQGFAYETPLWDSSYTNLDEVFMERDAFRIYTHWTGEAIDNKDSNKITKIHGTESVIVTNGLYADYGNPDFLEYKGLAQCTPNVILVIDDASGTEMYKYQSAHYDGTNGP